jgi:hypothetical protein
LRRPRWRGEEEDEEQCGKRTLHHRPSFTIPFVPAQAGKFGAEGCLLLAQSGHDGAAKRCFRG